MREMTVYHKAELFVVAPGIIAKVQGVRKILVILPNIWQQHFKSTAAIPFDGAVLHYPMEEIVGVPCVTAELIYRFTVVRNQTVVYVDRNFRQIRVKDIPMR